ncbi:MAG TPA: TIM barrel protein [Terriglobales bacterium]|nr:TIM barrel protein [Terriglobales bacterium]
MRRNMNRRTFGRTVAGTLVSSLPVGAASRLEASESANVDKSATAPFDTSVMLWTVFRNLPFETRLEKVAEAGYRNVELVGEYANWSDSDFNRANAKRKELGINFDCTAGLKNGLCDPRQRDGLIVELRGTIPIMERLDCPTIILLSGNVVPGMSVEAEQQSCVDGLRAAAAVVNGREINGKPIRILLENIDQEENPKYFLTSAARGFEIVRAVGHPQVQFLYDFFHEQIAEGNLIEKLEKNIDYLGLVHIADVPGRHEPGTGEINYGNIFRKLAELNYRKIAAMEFLPSGDPVSQLRSAREMALQAGARTNGKSASA